jgi:hypothetical protein
MAHPVKKRADMRTTAAGNGRGGNRPTSGDAQHWDVVLQIGEELRRRPRIPLGVLQAFAAQLDPGIAGMDPRRFHSLYVIPARQPQPKPRARRPRRPVRHGPAPTSAAPPPPASSAPSPASEVRTERPSQPERQRIRSAFFKLAHDLAESNDRVHWVRVLTRLDEYIVGAQV